VAVKKKLLDIVRDKIKEGLSKSAIARKLGLSRDTIAKYAKLPKGHTPLIKRVANRQNVLLFMNISQTFFCFPFFLLFPSSVFKGVGFAEKDKTLFSEPEESKA